MPPSVPARQLGEAILNAAQNGTYPDSEDIISANFPPSAFPQALELLKGAREEVKIRVRKSSKSSAQDIDGWILQAKQLRTDIETAQASAADIRAKAARDEELRQGVRDARSKLRLLEQEVAFNHDLAGTLEQVQTTSRSISQIQDLLGQGHLFEAVESFLHGDSELGSMHTSGNINAVALLQHEMKELRREIGRGLTRGWHDVIRVNTQAFTVSLHDNVERLFTLAEALQKMGLLQGLISEFADKLESAVVKPRLHLRANIYDRLLTVEDETLKVSETCSPLDIHRLFSDMDSLLDFLQTRLPPSVVGPLSNICGPRLVESLIATRLSSAVPQEIAALQEFNHTREEVYRFSETMTSHSWPGVHQLRAWTNSIPQVWLEKRQRQSLDHVRQLLKRGLGDFRTVERVETQTVSQRDRLYPGTSGKDDWNAGWSDEEDKSLANNDVKHQNITGDDEEEDVSAWGLDDEGDEESDSRAAASSAADDDEADWAWGDDENNEGDSKGPRRETVIPANREINGHVKSRRGSEREMTLRENYSITSLPVGILDLINGVISEMDILGKQEAGASNFYSINDSGLMYLYNDCLWLTDQLRQITLARRQRLGHSSTRALCEIRFDDDIAALEAFGRRSYGKEMDSQRTIIKDLLDGAQGFSNSTEPPFSQECDLAVNSINDRLRHIHKQWKSVLSHSALLQSIGSLLSTVIDKVIIDIEDMNDISEPESQRLTAYCKQLIALEDLFLPDLQPGSAHSGQQEAVPLPAVYAPGWFKFQFLSEILDSSLVDIKYLWTEGGLQLEYDTEEVVDLIEALFADSEHRRKAIAEIRRSSGR
ncbi:MAG: hypothetical protein Q9184_000106 [Pyrenodesmia sp. 2 TL-2023]